MKRNREGGLVHNATKIIGTREARTLSNPFLIFCIAQQVVQEERDAQEWYKSHQTNRASGNLFKTRVKVCRQNYKVLLNLRALNTHTKKYWYENRAFTEDAERVFLTLHRLTIDKYYKSSISRMYVHEDVFVTLKYTNMVVSPYRITPRIPRLQFAEPCLLKYMW